VSDKKIAMVAPKLTNYHNKALKSGGTWISRAFYSGHIPENKKNIIKEIPYLGVGMVRKDFVDMFGYLFDPDYFIYAEDLDLGMRIRLSDKKIVFNPNAILYHMHAVTTQKTNGIFTTFLMERNSLITFFKILSLKNIVFYFPYVLAIRSFAILRDLATFKFLNVYARLRSLFWIIFNLNVVIKKRKETQKFRKVNDEYITKIFSEKYLFKKPFII
jgi:GT2 family glycosyltransferase